MGIVRGMKGGIVMTGWVEFDGSGVTSGMDVSLDSSPDGEGSLMMGSFGVSSARFVTSSIVSTIGVDGNVSSLSLKS